MRHRLYPRSCYFDQPVLQHLLGQRLLEVAHLATQVPDRIRRGLARRITRQPPLAGFREHLRPAVVEPLDDPLPATQRGDAVLTPQAGSTMRIFSSAEYCLCVRRRLSGTVASAPAFDPVDSRLIYVPFGHYDEPEILPYANHSIWPIGADVRHLSQVGASGKAGAVAGRGASIVGAERRSLDIHDMHKLDLCDGIRGTHSIRQASKITPQAGRNPMKASKFTGLLGGLALVISTGQAAQAQSPEEITIAYFLEWAMPFEYAKAQREFEKEMGVKIIWRAFDTGNAMSAAMASGDVQIAVSQGVPPFIVATSAGQDLQMIDVAVSYSGNDNCVVSDRLDITKANVKELEGRKVAVPIGTAAQFDFLKQMEHFGVDSSTMQIVDMAPADGAAALAQGNVDMACGFGGGLQRMEEHGHVLMTGAEKDEIGLHVFDVISTPAGFAAANPELLTKFLNVVHKANSEWNSGTEAQARMLPVIAKDAGMDVDVAEKMLKGFSFLDYTDTLGSGWMGGGTQEYLKEVANFFQQTGNTPKALGSYDDAVNAELLKAAEKM